MAALRAAGKLRHLGLTNFDTQRLQIMLERGLPIVSNQVQYSLVDRRPEVAMAPFCQEHGVVLFTYGTLLGGLLSERYLGRAEPGPRELTTVSLRKYKQMIDAWGGWALFQELLQAASQVAERHGVSIANVAVRAILDRPAVAGVIVGALGWAWRSTSPRTPRLQLPIGRRGLGAAGRGAGQVTRSVQGDRGLWG